MRFKFDLWQKHLRISLHSVLKFSNIYILRSEENNFILNDNNLTTFLFRKNIKAKNGRSSTSFQLWQSYERGAPNYKSDCTNHIRVYLMDKHSPVRGMG